MHRHHAQTHRNYQWGPVDGEEEHEEEQQRVSGAQ
jgi:hypothetical protein